MISVAEIKALLQITSTDYDTLIAVLIPIVQNDIVGYCNNTFTQYRSARYTGRISDGSLVFVASAKTITTTNTDVNLYFNSNYAVGDTIRIDDTTFNDGFYTITAVTTTVITVSETIVDETISDYVGLIRYVLFPASLDLVFADMVNFRIKSTDSKGITSQSLGDYSVTYNTTGAASMGGYSSDIMSALDVYKVVKIS